GSLNPTYDPGDVMVIQDHVNLTGHNPLIGPNPTDSKTKKPLGPRFPDLRNLYDREISAQLLRSLDQQKMRAHLGTYLGVLGPSFETPAEVRLFSKWGLDAVGMSTVWEAIALAHSGATVAGVALISNVGCGLRDDAPLDHHEILRTSKAAAQKIISSVFQVVANLPEDR
ncbi:MAG TPA: purine-nucleoside phosphorylase, partial [Oligoflexia bacterium]|nr:purine-nucleoside phosphorylase [Oligoflexia bacterium]